MRNMKTILFSLILAAALPRGLLAAETYAASGRINQVDAAHDEVNITHGPIAGLGWPGMTMTFPVADKTATKPLRAGQAVKFWLEKRDGRYVITRIEPTGGSK